MTQEIFEFIKQCPCFENFTFNIDYLGRKVNSISLSGRCKNETVKKYTDGDSMNKSTYDLKLRLPFGADGAQNADNAMLLDEISEWFHKQNTQSNFPYLNDSDIVVSIVCDFEPDCINATSDSLVVEAKIGIVYYKVR